MRLLREVAPILSIAVVFLVIVAVANQGWITYWTGVAIGGVYALVALSVKGVDRLRQ